MHSENLRFLMLMGHMASSMLLGAAAVVIGGTQEYWILLPMAGLVVVMSYFGKKALKSPEREKPESPDDALHRRKMELVAAKRASGLVKYDYGLVDLERELKRDADEIAEIWSK